MTNTITAYRSYFETLATNHSKIQFFQYGGSERVLNQLRSTADFPLMWLGIPDVRIERDEEEGTLFDGSLVILGHARPDDWEHEKEQENLTYIIAKQIVTRMRYDDEERIIELDSAPMLEPVAPWSADNAIGWSISFRVRVPSDCIQEDIDDRVWRDLNMPDVIGDMNDDIIVDDFETVVGDDNI